MPMTKVETMKKGMAFGRIWQPSIFSNPSHWEAKTTPFRTYSKMLRMRPASKPPRNTRARLVLTIGILRERSLPNDANSKGPEGTAAGSVRAAARRVKGKGRKQRDEGKGQKELGRGTAQDRRYAEKTGPSRRAPIRRGRSGAAPLQVRRNQEMAT